MRELWLIGIGAGNPDHLTGQGRRAILDADLILIPRKGEDKADLAELRRRLVASVRDDSALAVVEFDMPTRELDLPYLDAVERWHDAIAETWRAAVARSPKARSVALLVWGDPSLYDSALRIADRLAPKPPVRVFPGITALQALTAAHAIPLISVGGSVVVSTGRRLRDRGWPTGADALAVMLDGDCAFRTLPPDRFVIWWGAYLGMKNELLCAGALADVGDRIIDIRAKARAKHGWIMDTYLLRPSQARGNPVVE